MSTELEVLKDVRRILKKILKVLLWPHNPEKVEIPKEEL